MAHYLSVAEARQKDGLRLVLTAGVPGPWGEAAKGLLHVKRIPYLKVRQAMGEPNEELQEWTGHNNAPIAVYDDERPRAGWSEILFLAERLAPDRPLIPERPADRALMFGLAHEICGENGFGWSRRVMMLDPVLAPGTPDLGIDLTVARAIGARYGYSPAAAEAARSRCAGILRLLAAHLHEQRSHGRSYFIGESLSALDIYWATFAAMVEPLPPNACPMPAMLRMGYELTDPLVRPAADPILLEHRDFIYTRHLGLPMDF